MIPSFGRSFIPESQEEVSTKERENRPWFCGTYDIDLKAKQGERALPCVHCFQDRGIRRQLKFSLYDGLIFKDKAGLSIPHLSLFFDAGGS
jgi:hypothetical protein